MSKVIVDLIGKNLSDYTGSGTAGDESGLFDPLIQLVVEVVNTESNLLYPVRLWERDIAPLVAYREKQLPKGNIHKGATYFNNGVCLNLAGDFDKANFYFVKAAEQDRLSGTSDALKDMLTGKHVLSKQLLVDPIVRQLLPIWQCHYKAITDQALDDVELGRVMTWLAKRPTDAYLMIIAMQRLRHIITFDESNEAVGLANVMALSDMIVSMESALKRYCLLRIPPATPKATLYPMLNDHVLKPNAAASAAFAGSAWTNVSGVNAVMAEGIKRIENSTATTAQNMGTAAYVVQKIRNGVMHVNDTSIDLYTDRKLAEKIGGLILAICRTGQFAEEDDAAFAALA